MIYEICTRKCTRNARILTISGVFFVSKNKKNRVHKTKEGLSGNSVGISINFCKSVQKESFINYTP